MTNPPACSFCGAHNDQVVVLVASIIGTAYICDQCVADSQKLIDKYKADKDGRWTLKRFLGHMSRWSGA